MEKFPTCDSIAIPDQKLITIQHPLTGRKRERLKKTGEIEGGDAGGRGSWSRYQDTLINPTPIFVSVEPRFQNSSFS